MTGRLVRMPADKAFGFINKDGKDYFFHKDDYDGDWGQLLFDFNTKNKVMLEFDDVTGQKGPRAGSVKRVEL